MTITITAVGFFSLLGWLALAVVLGYLCFGVTVLGMFDDIAPWPYWIFVSVVYVVCIGILAVSGFALWP